MIDLTLHLNLITTGILLGLVYSLIAMGIAIIFKTTKVVNFSQGMLATLGAYVTLFGIDNLGLPPWISVLLSLAVGVVLAVALERVVLRQFIGEPILSVIIVTLSLAAFFRGIVMLVWGPNFVPFPKLFGAGALRIGEVSLVYEYLTGAAVALAYMGGLALFFRKTVLGAALRAVSEDHMAATAMGISVKRSTTIAWALGVLTSVIGGVLLASNYGGVGRIIEYTGVIALPAVILGGLDSIPGAVVGGVIVGLLEVYGVYYMEELVAAGFGRVFPLLVMLFVMLVKPYGLWGTERIERV
jgi:branched-chain amino acid transport system permease protein